MGHSLQWWDSEAGFKLILSQPPIDRYLWEAYAENARLSYRRRDVECALDLEALRTGDDTVMFFVALDKTGRMVAGARAIGPLQSPDDSHAVVEWAGQPGQAQVRAMIADRLSEGVLEMKSAWKVDVPGRNRTLTELLARIGFHITSLLDVRYFMATAPTYLVDKWQTSGALVASIPETPYPDERFQTKMMCWDRASFAQHATPEQASKIHFESTRLLHTFYREAGSPGGP